MKLSSVKWFSVLLGFLSFVLSILGIYFLDSSKLYSEKTYLIGLLIGGIVFGVSFLLFKNYIKRKFKEIYSSIGLDYNNSLDLYNKEIQQEIEDWVSNKTSEIDQLKTTEAFRKEFFGNLAHELKTPVFSVEGYILTLVEGGLEDPKINRKFLNKAAKGIDRITKLIGDMDTISNIESGRLTLDSKRVPLFELIESVMDDLEELAGSKNTKLVIEKPDIAELYITGDRLKLEQVFSNLISNSIFYGKKDGETIIKVLELRNKAEISIKDNGLGVDSKHLPRLFERFYRVEKSRDRNKGGSGIGLAIVKHIIEAHNQKISVSSVPDVGTEFIFTLEKG